MIVSTPQQGEPVDVGFIGLGTMGASMALNLARAGHRLSLHDVSPDAVDALLGRWPEAAVDPTTADSPAEIAADVAVVFTSLPGPAEMEAVALGPDGVADGASDGLAWFDLTTNSPTIVRRVADALADTGVEVFDAPVSGGPDGAASGRLAVWIGGDDDGVERWRPVLESFADQVRHVGPIGAGSVAKLVHNCSGYIIQTALAETFTMGVKAGVEADALWEAVRSGALGRRRTFDHLARQYLPGRFDPPDFALTLARKDVTLACELGRELDVPMRLSQLALQELTEAFSRGWGGRDSRAAMLLQEERAGVEVRVDPERIADVLDRDP
jgi:3-hydroxyisobutyrate dehydrogenase